jgi:hypothetical protein
VELNKSTWFLRGLRVISARRCKPLKVTQHADVRVEGVDRVLAELACVVKLCDTIREVPHVLEEELVLLQERDCWLQVVIGGVWRANAFRSTRARAALGSQVRVNRCVNQFAGWEANGKAITCKLSV